MKIILTEEEIKVAIGTYVRDNNMFPTNYAYISIGRTSRNKYYATIESINEEDVDKNERCVSIS